MKKKIINILGGMTIGAAMGWLLSVNYLTSASTEGIAILISIFCVVFAALGYYFGEKLVSFFFWWWP